MPTKLSSLALQPLNGHTVIFDFDGTLADTFRLNLEITNELFKMYRRPTLSFDQAWKERSLSAREWAHHHEIPWWMIPLLLWQGRKRFRHKVDTITLFPETESFLLRLHTAGYTLGIVSSNTTEVIKKVLSPETAALFSWIESEPGIWKKGKRLQKILSRNRIDKKRVWYVGDEVRDIQAANQAKIPCIAVTWGFNSAKRLREASPEAVVETPAQLIAALKKRTQKFVTLKK